MGEIGPKGRRSLPSSAGIAAILIPAFVGLTLGKSAAPEKDPVTLTASQMFDKARSDTLRQMRQETALKGYRDGVEIGHDQGHLSGARAGNFDAMVIVQEQRTGEAQAAAASAQAELGAISAPLPTPTAPTPDVEPEP